MFFGLSPAGQPVQAEYSIETNDVSAEEQEEQQERKTKQYFHIHVYSGAAARRARVQVQPGFQRRQLGGIARTDVVIVGPLQHGVGGQHAEGHGLADALAGEGIGAADGFTGGHHQVAVGDFATGCVCERSLAIEGLGGSGFVGGADEAPS